MPEMLPVTRATMAKILRDNKAKGYRRLRGIPIYFCEHRGKKRIWPETMNGERYA